MDVITTAIFVVECLLKIITFGFIANGKPSYLRNLWNLIDFIIIVLSVVSISPLATKLKVFKIFRILRVLRLISKTEGLRIGLQALVYAIPNVLRIVMILLVFFLIFGVIAISYFKGRFYFCDQSMLSDSIPTYATDFPLNNKWDCLNSGANWNKMYYTFDNMEQAMVSLFIMSNLSGWSTFMYTGVQVADID